MQTQRLNITLPHDLALDLRRNIPNGLRSRFIADALREKLNKRDINKELRKSAAAQKKIIKEIQEDFLYADEEAIKNLP